MLTLGANDWLIMNRQALMQPNVTAGVSWDWDGSVCFMAAFSDVHRPKTVSMADTLWLHVICSVSQTARTHRDQPPGPTEAVVLYRVTSLNRS